MSKLYHFNNYFSELHLTEKKAKLRKLLSQKGKYSGKRGKTVIQKINFIKEKYLEILV